MGAVATPDLTETERRMLRWMRADGAPFAVIPNGPGCARLRAAARLRDLGLVELWPGRGWYMTDAGCALREQLLETTDA